MKKLINHPQQVVSESLEGAALAQPDVALLEGRTILVRTDRLADGPQSDLPVALVSGGGAGHEPAHAGYVAPGMLSAAVSGGVFSSPSVDAVLDAIRAVTGRAGCLLVVKSYTGDRLNFGLAAQIARTEGYDVEMVVVADDVALADTDDNAGRRGLAGTVLVHKAAGAAAETGAALADVARVARDVAAEVGTIGIGLTPCIVPTAGEAGFELGADEVEVGLGIHGEPGVERRALAEVDHLVADLVDRLVADRGLQSEQAVVALVGSTGGTPPMELAITARAVAERCRHHGLRLERLWSGLVMTSLEMAGASVSLLPVDDQRLRLLDAETGSRAWPGRPDDDVPELRTVPVPAEPPTPADDAADDDVTRRRVGAVAEALLEAEDELTALDQVVGDGDLGTALARGAHAWRDEPGRGSAAAQLRHLSALVRRDVGGTSGPLYAAGLLAAAEHLEGDADWAGALRAASDAVRDLGGAEPGDCTMVDALAPAAEAAGQGLDAVIAAAQQGSERTAELTARRGRTSYLGDRAHGHPDPGAVAVVTWLRALRDAG